MTYKQAVEAANEYLWLTLLDERTGEQVARRLELRRHTAEIIEALQARIAELEAGMESIVMLDRSKRYEYGEPRQSDGQKPGTGERWLTPAEKAKAFLPPKEQKNEANT